MSASGWQGHEMLDERPRPPVPIRVLAEGEEAEMPSTENLNRILKGAQAGAAVAPAVPRPAGSGRKCSGCGQPGHRIDRCPGLEVVSPAPPATRARGEVLETEVFHSLGGGRLELRLLTAKRVPFEVRMKHRGCGKPGAGVVAVATDERDARAAFKRAANQAAERRWRPGAPPAAARKLSEIPMAPVRAYHRRKKKAKRGRG